MRCDFFGSSGEGIPYLEIVEGGWPRRGPLLQEHCHMEIMMQVHLCRECNNEQTGNMESGEIIILQFSKFGLGQEGVYAKGGH